MIYRHTLSIYWRQGTTEETANERLERFESVLALEQKAPETRRTYLKGARLFEAWCKEQKKEPGKSAVIDFLAYLQTVEKLKPTTLRTYHCALRVYFRVLSWDFPKVRTPRVPRTRPKALSEYDYAKLLDAAQEGLERTMLTVIYATGMRISEAVSRRKEHLMNWGEGLTGKEALLIEGKTDNPQPIPLTERAVIALKWHMAENEALLGRPLKKGDHLLMNAGKSVPVRTANDIWHRMLDRAGIEPPEGQGFGWHVIRHTRATHLRARKVPLEDIKDLLRHRSIGTTLIYAETDVEALRDAIKDQEPEDKQ